MPQVALDAGIIRVRVWHLQIGIDRTRRDGTRIAYYAADFTRSKNRWETWINASRFCRERGWIKLHTRGTRVGPVVGHRSGCDLACKTNRDGVNAIVVAAIAGMDGPLSATGWVKCEADSRRKVIQRHDRSVWVSLLRKPIPAGQNIWTNRTAPMVVAQAPINRHAANDVLIFDIKILMVNPRN